MLDLKINDNCDLVFTGSKSLDGVALQVADIIADAYKKNGLGSAGLSWSSVPPIRILMTGNGGIEIGHRDKPETTFTTGMGFVTGTLNGIGLAKGKNPVLDLNGVDGDCMSPCCAAVRFSSFADLAECANAMTKDVNKTVDIPALRQITGQLPKPPAK